MNLISHVSAQQTRIAVVGYDTKPPATPDQLKRMQQLVARSMEEGAWGLVTRFESGPTQLSLVAVPSSGEYFFQWPS